MVLHWCGIFFFKIKEKDTIYFRYQFTADSSIREEYEGGRPRYRQVFDRHGHLTTEYTNFKSLHPSFPMWTMHILPRREQCGIFIYLLLHAADRGDALRRAITKIVINRP